MTIQFNEEARGLLLFALPPGAFIGLGLLVAMKNVIDEKLSQPKAVAVKLTRTTTADASA